MCAEEPPLYQLPTTYELGKCAFKMKKDKVIGLLGAESVSQ